jgi:hypothetical protein
MAADATGFVATFPEFQEAYDLQPEMIERAVVRAQAYVSQRIWGDRYEAGVYQKTAHLLAMGGLGENLRIDAKAATAYGVVFAEMVQALPIRMLISGGFGGYFGGGCP